VARLLALPLIALIVSCAGSTADLPIETSATLCCAAKPVRFEYLGTGGWMVARGDDALLTAPFFTNPGLLRVPFRIRASRDRVRRHFENVEGRERVEIVLAGHSHYDHIGDMPEVLWLVPRATVYGGTTMKHLLGDRAESVIDKVGQWKTVGNIRFMPMLSEHAAHYRGLKLFGGHLDAPVAEVPRRAWGWKEGEPLAYLIDLLDANGRTEFRIYYDDTAHNSPYGYPDRATLDDGHPVDVAILCAASFHETADYPAALLAYLRPAHVLVGHWEDFFTSPDAPERTVRGTNIRAFLEQLRPYPFTMLKRHGKATFTGKS
jgi:L-ascorbate metabolism protein UlaG (beta-lactamase superfamily)